MLQYTYRDFVVLLDSVVSSLCNYQTQRWGKIKKGGGRRRSMVGKQGERIGANWEGGKH